MGSGNDPSLGGDLEFISNNSEQHLKTCLAGKHDFDDKIPKRCYKCFFVVEDCPKCASGNTDESIFHKELKLCYDCDYEWGFDWKLTQTNGGKC